MYSELSRVKTMVQALAVADRQREVTRSFSKKEHRHDDQTSTPLTLLAATLPLLALSSITPFDIKDEPQFNHQFESTKEDEYLKSTRGTNAPKATGDLHSAMLLVQTRAGDDSIYQLRRHNSCPSHRLRVLRLGLLILK